MSTMSRVWIFLHLLMNTFLDLPFQDPRSCRLVEVGNFQDMCRINPIVRPTAHDRVDTTEAFIDRDLVREVSGDLTDQGSA